MPVPASFQSDAVDDKTPSASALLPPLPTTLAGSQAPTHFDGRRLYLAVDCGGSKAAAAISISSASPGGPPVFLSCGFGGAANYTDVGLHRFLRSVRQAVENALDESGLAWRHLPVGRHGSISSPFLPSTVPSDPATSSSSATPTLVMPFPQLFYAAWLGIAGVDSPLNISVLSPHLSNLFALPYPSARLIVANDTSLLASPVLERDPQQPADELQEGVVCIAGTGSIVMSFRSKNRAHCAQPSQQQRGDASNSLLEVVGRAGGFGWLLGDEAGGYMVGRKAVRTVLDQADRERLGADEYDEDDDAAEGSSGPGSAIPPSAEQKHLLRDRILAQWNLTSTDDLLDAVYSIEATTSNTQVANGHERASAVTSEASSAHSDEEEEDEEPRFPVSESAFAHSPIPAISSSPASPIRKLSLDDTPSHDSTAAQAACPLFGDTSASAAKEQELSATSHIAQRANSGSPNQVSAASSSPSRSSLPGSGAPAVVGTGIRKLRLASLAPVVFQLAFTNKEPMSLGILKAEIKSISNQIQLLVQRDPVRRTHHAESGSQLSGFGLQGRPRDPRRVSASHSVLCLGGSLLGVEGYRQLLVDELKSRGCVFKRVVHVEDVARRGSEALARGWEGDRQGD